MNTGYGRYGAAYNMVGLHCFNEELLLLPKNPTEAKLQATSTRGHQGARNSGNSLGKILVFSANFLENFYNFSVANNNVCNLDINNYYSVSTITKPIPIFTIFIFTVTLPNVLYLKTHTSKILVSAITTLGH